MPTLEALKDRATAIKKKIAEKGESIEPLKLRTMRKRLRRAQRGVRARQAAAQRIAVKSQKKQKKAEG